MTKNKEFSPGTKLAIVMLYLKREPGMTVAEICRKHGISRVHLKLWVAALDERKDYIFAHGKTIRKLVELRKANERLEKDNFDLRMLLREREDQL